MVSYSVSGKTLAKVAIVGGIAVPFGILLWRRVLYNFGHPNAQAGPSGPPNFIYGPQGMGRPEQQGPATAKVPNLF